MAVYRIMRLFRSSGRLFKPGEQVDGSELQKVEALTNQRYIRLVDTGVVTPQGAGPSPDPKLVENEVKQETGKKMEGAQIVEDDDDDAGDEAHGRLRGPTPDEFPGKKFLDDAGFTTYAKVRKQLDTLEDIDGIGKKTAEKIRDIFAKESEPEPEGEGEGEGTGDGTGNGSASEPTGTGEPGTQS